MGRPKITIRVIRNDRHVRLIGTKTMQPIGVDDEYLPRKKRRTSVRRNAFPNPPCNQTNAIGRMRMLRLIDALREIQKI